MFILLTSLFGFGTLGHLIGSGLFNSNKQMLIFLLSSLFISVIPVSRELNGPGLALLILISQFATHAILQGNPSSNLKMSLAHTGAGIASYWVIKLLDQSLISLAYGLVRYIRHKVLLLSNFIPTEVHVDFQRFTDFHKPFRARILLTSSALRAPPIG